MATTTISPPRQSGARVAPAASHCHLSDCFSLAFGAHIGGVLVAAGGALPDTWLGGVCLVTGVIVAGATIGYWRAWCRQRRAAYDVLTRALRRAEGRG